MLIGLRVVIYSTDQCGYRDTFGLYTTRIGLVNPQINGGQRL